MTRSSLRVAHPREHVAVLRVDLALRSSSVSCFFARVVAAVDVGDDVRVRRDVAVGRDEEAGAGAADRFLELLSARTRSRRCTRPTRARPTASRSARSSAAGSAARRAPRAAATHTSASAHARRRSHRRPSYRVSSATWASASICARRSRKGKGLFRRAPDPARGRRAARPAAARRMLKGCAHRKNVLVSSRSHPGRAARDDHRRARRRARRPRRDLRRSAPATTPTCSRGSRRCSTSSTSRGPRREPIAATPGRDVLRGSPTSCATAASRFGVDAAVRRRRAGADAARPARCRVARRRPRRSAARRRCVRRGGSRAGPRRARARAARDVARGAVARAARRRRARRCAARRRGPARRARAPASPCRGSDGPSCSATSASDDAEGLARAGDRDAIGYRRHDLEVELVGRLDGRRCPARSSAAGTTTARATGRPTAIASSSSRA